MTALILLFITLLLPINKNVQNNQEKNEIVNGGRIISGVVQPSIDVYLPPTELNTGCAVILCPGGAMRYLSWGNDVEYMAKRLNEAGIAAIGLKYRLNNAPMPGGGKMPALVDVTGFDKFYSQKSNANPMHSEEGDKAIDNATIDAKNALRLVRDHAEEWGIDPEKTGFMGFSAGGGVSLAATVKSEGKDVPSFVISVFGPSLIDVDVPKPTPPLLILTRAEHPNVAAGCLSLFLDWKKAGGNAEMHMYGDGVGPFGPMEITGKTTTEQWQNDALSWLEAKGFTSPSKYYTFEGGGTGPYPSVLCREFGNLDYTIYRPKDMKAAVDAEKKPLPLVLFANGGCAYTSKGFEKYLTEIASHGYIVAAVGQYEEIPDSMQWKMGMTDTEYMIHAMDVMQKLNEDSLSNYYHMIDMTRIAAMGQSCGGGQALTAGVDPRITTVIALNSGFLDTDPPFPIEIPGSKRTAEGPKDGFARSVVEGGVYGKKFGGTAGLAGLPLLHTPLLYLVGGPDDVAYPNAQNNFKLITKVPVSFASLPVGHGGTYAQPHGGLFAKVTLMWLDWRMKGIEDQQQFFVDSNFRKAWFPDWEVYEKNPKK